MPRHPHILRRKGTKNWSVRVRVPASANGGAPGHIVRSLKTANDAEARKRAPVVVAEIRAEIEARRRNPDGTRKDHAGPQTKQQLRDAAWWKEHRLPDPGAQGRFIIPSELANDYEHTIEEILGEPVGEELEPGRPPSPAYDPARERAALAFVGEVTGTHVPVADEIDRYIQQEGITASYAYRTRSAVRRLGEWLAGQPQGNNRAVVNGRVADRFADHLSAGAITTDTVNSLISALSAYWTWMQRRHLVSDNPWRLMQRRRVDRSGNAEKRAFTDAEIVKLLTGKTYSTLHDLMRMAALTGMRLNEISRLRVVDVSGGWVTVAQSKTDAGRRRIPLHAALKPLVERRSAAKEPSEFLFEELTAPASRPDRRGYKAGERFTAYRRALELDERAEGRRQANADFHSFRRWFATKLEHAGVFPPTMAALMGHEEGRQLLVLSTYSEGPSEDQLRKAVEAVRLPEGAPEESPEGKPMGAGRGPRAAKAKALGREAGPNPDRYKRAG